jgi:uncharacterized protein YggE
MRPLLPLLLLTAACSTAPRVVAVPMEAPPDPPGTYTVTGTATIEAVPDTADLVVVLSAERARPRDAAAAVRESQKVLTEALAQAAGKSCDVAVSQLQLAPVHELVDPRGSKTRLRGYEAQLTVVITTHDFEVLPELMDLAASSGATELSSQFRVGDLPALKLAARQNAAKVARQKAEALTEVLGVTLGPVRAIEERSGEAWDGANERNFAQSYREAAPEEGIHGVAEEITVTVTVTYDLG